MRHARQTKRSGPAPGGQAAGGRAMDDLRPAALAQRKLQQAVSGSTGAAAASTRAQAAAAARDALPAQLQAGIEQLAGIPMDHVKVHYNSVRPAQLQALAYAQGAHIHLGPGQQQHLPHEAWHVVQQVQGRVRPTTQAAGVPVNNDNGLEREADIMGARAAQTKPASGDKTTQAKAAGAAPGAVAQCQMAVAFGGGHLSDRNRAKMQAVVADLRHFGARVPQIATLGGLVDNMVVISVEDDGGTNPAATSVHGQHIDITLQNWFIDMSSGGEIAGMITHEIGVHTLADQLMTAQQHAAEAAAEGAAFVGQVIGGHAMNSAAWTGAGPGEARQRDHVNMARGAGGAPAAAVRARHYVNTMLGLGDAIEASARAPAAKLLAQRDLLNTFFFDVGRIMASDDGGARQQFNASDAVAHAFNWYRAQVLTAPVIAAHSWLNEPGLNVAASSWGLRAMLIGKVGGYISARFNVSAAGRSPVGDVVRGVGLAVGGVAKGVGSVVSGLARGGNAIANGNVMTGLGHVAKGIAGGIGHPLLGAARAAHHVGLGLGRGALAAGRGIAGAGRWSWNRVAR